MVKEPIWLTELPSESSAQEVDIYFGQLIFEWCQSTMDVVYSAKQMMYDADRPFHAAFRKILRVIYYHACWGYQKLFFPVHPYTLL